MADERPAQSKRAPTLYAIIAIKFLKGVSLLLLAFGVYRLAGHDLLKDFHALLDLANLDPERQFFIDLAARINEITPANIYWVAAGTAFYSLFSLVEATGLWLRISWVGWMTIGESIFFIPIEVYELIRQFSFGIAGILALNILIVWYLLQIRKRLFKHHHWPHPPAPPADLSKAQV